MRKSLRLSLSLLSFATLGAGFANAQLELAAPAAESVAPADNTLVSGLNLDASVATPGSNLYVTQWVRADEVGSLRGTVTTFAGSDSVAVGNGRVSLVRGGEVINAGLTNVNGEFALQNVQPGAYTVLAQGDNALAVYSLVVLDAVNGQHLPNSAEIRALAPVSNRVIELLRGQSLPSVGRSVAMIRQDPIKASRLGSVDNAIQLDADGGLSGRLTKPTGAVNLSGTTAFVFKDGREVMRTSVAADGSFHFAGVQPGSYGLVASGSQGVAALGFSAVGRQTASTSKNGQTFVNVQAGSSLNVELADVNGYVPAPADQPLPEQIVDAPFTPMMGGGFQGGGSFGGGGGGGFGGPLGGLGTLGAIGGLTAAAIVAGTNNNDGPKVSPVVP